MSTQISRRSFLKLGAGASAVITAGFLAACNSNNSTGKGTAYKIGVLQLVEHQALDAANKGFVEALEESGLQVKIDQQNAQNDQTACQTIAAKLVNDGNDLILAIATPAAQAVAGATSDIPIVATAVTDFVESGLVKDKDKPGTNVTGASDLTPVKEQIDLIGKILPNAKKVGILYASSESNSVIQAKMAADAAKAKGLETQDFTVSSSNEIQQVVESMVGKVDVCYAPTDNTIAAGMTTVGMVATENKLPVITGEENMCKAGGLATLSINYHDLGKKAGEMAVKILKGEAKPQDMPIEYLSESEYTLVTNDETAKALGIDLSALKN